MVVDQRTLKANILRSSIGSNVRNKLTGQQAQTPVQQTTPTIQQQPVQQQPETYKVITNKFPTYDVKDLMGFGPQAVKNQLGFANSMNHYNKLQAQADANTDPNVRYNLTKPQLTNKETLQIEQATPQTNEQGLKINKTNSFKDLVADLQNVANQGRSLEFVKFRDLYPEYVENWDKVVDLFESIKSNPQYSAEQVTTTAQKAYPELFGINENYSDSDKMTALKKLYDEMVSNKQNGIQLTQQDIIDKYPEYANTEDINTVMEIQNLMNKDKKSTPTFNDIAENFDSMLKGNVEVGNTEKSTMKKDIDKINNMSQSTYEHLSEEGKKYVQYLATAKQIADYVKEQYYTKASDVEIVENLKNKDPELYNEIFGDLDIQANLSEEDRKLLDEGYTIGAGKSRWTETKHSATEKLAGLGRKLQSWAGTEWKGERNPQPVNGQREDGTYERNPLMREDGTLETDPIKIREIKMAGNNYQQRVRMQEYRGKNPGMDKIDYKIGEFLFELGEEIQNVGEKGMEKIESSQERKDIAELNKTKFWDALKKGDVKTMLSKSTAALGQSTIDMGLGALTGDPLLAFGSMYAGSYERAMQDIESDENLKGMTREEKERAARLMAGVESVIEEASMSVMMPGVFGGEGALSKLLPGFDNALLKGIVQTELGAASEGGEEVLQELFNSLITRSYGSNRELGNLQDYWDIFNETFLSSQLMSAIGGTKEGIQQTQINQIQNEIKKQGELRNTVLEGQALISENFNDFAQRVEEVPGTTTEELQQVWNNAQEKKQDLEQKANNITSNSYNNVNVPSYERTQINESENKLSAKESQEYTDLLDEMEKNGEITKEDRKKVEMSLGVFTRNTEKTEQPQTEGLAEVAETPKTEKKTGWWTRKMSGLDNETITRIENNPYISSYWNNAVNMVEKEGLSMDNGKIIEQPMQELGEELLKRIEKAEKDLGEDGRMYRLIKDIKETYDLSDSRKGIEGVLKNYDITTNEDGKLDFSNSQFIKAEDTNAISRAVELLNNTDLTNITPKQYWNLRKKLSSLSGFDKGTSKDGEAVVRQLRHLVDQLAKDNIPGLKKVDEIFSKELKYLEEIKQGLVYQQGERKGQIKDNFYSILKTINNQNRQQMNQRLEKIMPDLSDKVEAINMLPKLLKAYAVKSRLIEVGARNIGKVGGVVTGGIPGLVVGYVFDEITGKVSKNLRKNAINKIVNSMSDTAKQRLEDIAAKQEEKETLTQEERETLNQVKAEIEKIIEQENNEQKPQTQSETEKKSEKKTNKAEQVQGMAKINQNKKTETKGLGQISKKENIISENQKRINELWNVKEENGVKYIEVDGKRYENKKPDTKSKRDWNRQQFTNSYIFNPKQKEYVKEVSDLIESKRDEAHASDDIYLTKYKYIHIFEDHGAFAPENLVETINNPSDIVEHPFEQDNIQYYLKKIPGTNSFFKAVVEQDGGKKTTTFFERVSANKTTYENELKKQDMGKEKNPRNKKGDEGYKPSPSHLSDTSITKTSEKSIENETKQEGMANISKTTEKQDTKNQTLEYYASGDGMRINKYLRDPEGFEKENGKLSEKDKQMIKDLDEATQEDTVKDGTLYRAVDIKVLLGDLSDGDIDDLTAKLNGTDYNNEKVNKAIEDVENGKILTEDGFMSTTKKKYVADNWDGFSGGDYDVTLELNNTRGLKGKDMEEFDVKGDEQYEVLLPRGTKYKLTGIELNDAGGVLIRAEIVRDEDTATTKQDQTETPKQEGLAAISVKVENGKVVKESEVDTDRKEQAKIARDSYKQETKGMNKSEKIAKVKSIINAVNEISNRLAGTKNSGPTIEKLQMQVDEFNNILSELEGNNKTTEGIANIAKENETVETPQEFEVLPADVRVADEEKQIGSKRIAPDRVPRQQTTYQGGIDKVYEKVKTIAEYMRVTDKYYSKDGHRDQNIAERFKKLRTDVQNILYGNEGFRFASDKSKEFKELWKNISDNKMLVAPLKEIAKNFYISRVKKDISKGYVYPQEVLEQIPGAEKAVNARQRYEKGLDTSFSAKDNRIDYSEKDVIGAGIKSQDGKQVTNEQKQDIVKGILDFGKTMGLDMKKFAEDRGLVYVHLHGGSPFLSTFGGMYREATSEQGDKNISVSVGGAENIRYKDKKTKERKTETLNTTMSHELGHAMDYLVDKRLLSWEQKSILRTKFNPVNRLYDYYSRPTEITARAIEQYVAIENGQADYYEENGNLDAGEFKGTDLEYALKEVGSYYERPGYWNKSDYENYVKPYVEEAFKNNFNEYKTDTIGGKDIKQIKQEAVQRGLAEISNF